MYRCSSCGNEDMFVAEVLIPHWAKVDGYGNVTSVDEALGGSEEEMAMEHRVLVTECYECNSNSIGELD